MTEIDMGQDDPEKPEPNTTPWSGSDWLLLAVGIVGGLAVIGV